MTFSSETAGPVIIFGSANKEYVLQCEDLVLGNKHTVVAEELLGGSGINYTLRLLAAGYEVMPILPIGNDQIGHNIRNELLGAADKFRVSQTVLDFIESDNFFAPGISTSITTVIVHGLQRTIFSQKLHGGEHFRKHIEKRINDANTLLNKSPSAIIIGHIQSDSGEYSLCQPGECTRYIIDAYHHNSLIYTNFGNSQIRLGIKFWEKELQHTDIFQLNIEEAVYLFSENNVRKSLAEIVQLLKHMEITAVITLGRFGAIGIHKDNKDVIILAWPITDAENIVDTTGAGDAFAAGMLSHLYDKPDFTFQEFYSAIELSGTWSAYACATLGASGQCPDKQTLEDFMARMPANSRRPAEIHHKTHAEQIMALIDIAYQ